MQWWAHDLFERGGMVLLVSWTFWVLFSIVLHELAHGWAALANGDRTPRELGHLTPNPVVHMGWMSLVFFAVLGIAWGQMPTNPYRYRHYRRGRFLVAAAGPAMNLLLAFLALTAAGLWAWAAGTGRISPQPHVASNVSLFLWIGGFLNLVLAAFNLLPVPPLDGSRILAAAVPPIERFYAQPFVAAYGMLIVLFLFFGAIQQPMQDRMWKISKGYTTWVVRTLVEHDPSHPAWNPDEDDDLPEEGANNPDPGGAPSRD